MNPIQKLLREQREEFENDFPFGSFAGSSVSASEMYYWHTTAQQQLIDVIIEEMKKEMVEIPELGERDLMLTLSAHNNALQTQINLIEEAKKE